MSAAKKIILLLAFLLTNLVSASALTPSATETRVGQKSFTALESRQVEPFPTPGLPQRNHSCGYELAPESLLAAKSGVWSLGPGPRGLAIESQLGGNLPAGFRVIDRFENGVATSIKSIDLNAATYQNAQALGSRLNGYVDHSTHLKVLVLDSSLESHR